MSIQTLTHLIIEYRYWIVIPLSLLEGPVVAFVSGTLASLGYFNIFVLAALFFIRDVGLDGIYYALGYFGGNTRFAKRMLAKMQVTDDHLNDVRILWDKYPGRTMLIGKLSYGIASAFIVVAGTIGMKLRKFFTYGALVAVAQYGTLLILGYLFGNALGGSFSRIIENVQYLIAGAAIVMTLYYIFGRYMRRKFFKNDEQL